MIDKWKGKGIDVDEVIFDDTPHVQHMRLEPEKYLSALDVFLRKNDLYEKKPNN